MEYLENSADNRENRDEILQSDYKAELENISVSMFKLFEKAEADFEAKIQEFAERCEALEQENVELKYKLRQLSEELKTLGEKIVSEVIRKTSIPESTFEEENGNNGDAL